MTAINPEDYGIYSDLFKDVHGFRPRGVLMENITQEDFDFLEVQLAENMVAEKIQQEADIKAFEASVIMVMEVGSVGRETAIAWLMDAEHIVEGTNYDSDYFCYTNGLPYGYFSEKTVA